MRPTDPDPGRIAMLDTFALSASLFRLFSRETPAKVKEAQRTVKKTIRSRCPLIVSLSRGPATYVALVFRGNEENRRLQDGKSAGISVTKVKRNE